MNKTFFYILLQKVVNFYQSIIKSVKLLITSSK